MCFSVSQTVPSLYSLSYLWGLSGCWLSMKRAGDFLVAVTEMAAHPALLWRRGRGGTKGDAWGPRTCVCRQPRKEAGFEKRRETHICKGPHSPSDKVLVHMRL